MKAPKIEKDMVKPLHETKFLNLYDLQYAEGAHYFSASRRSAENIVATKSDGEFSEMLPDAIGCCLIVKEKGQPAKVLLTREYRYPAGRFIIGPPSGIIDENDKLSEEPLITAAVREVYEETGIVIGESDIVYVANPFLLSSPGMSDESCALVCAIVHLDNLDCLSLDGAVGSEIFEELLLLDESRAKEMIATGRDEKGSFYSGFAWISLMYFLYGEWKKMEK